MFEEGTLYPDNQKSVIMPLQRIIMSRPFESLEEELEIRNEELATAEEDFERLERQNQEKDIRIAVLEREIALKTEENYRYWHEIIEMIHKGLE